MSTPSLPPLATRIADEFKKTTNPQFFSDDGFDALLTTQDRYVEDLAIESIRLARRDELDVVSKVHVANARHRLQQETERVAWLELFGGVLAGGGFAQVITNITGEGDPSTRSWLIALSITVVGVAMLAAAIARR